MDDSLNEFIMKLLYKVASFMRLLCIVYVIYTLLNTFVVDHRIVRGNSMYPTLRDSQHIFVSRLHLLFHDVERFDIVIAYEESLKKDVIKRVIGIPYDKIEMRDDHLYINDQEFKQDFLDEGYVSEIKKNYQTFTRDFGPIYLKENEYFLIGDNRVNSADSRNSSISTFKKESFKGVGVWSISEMRFVK